MKKSYKNSIDITINISVPARTESKINVSIIYFRLASSNSQFEEAYTISPSYHNVKRKFKFNKYLIKILKLIGGIIFTYMGNRLLDILSTLI